MDKYLCNKHLEKTINHEAHIHKVHFSVKDDFLIQLHATVVQGFQEGFSDANFIAAKMALSERTFHRRLKENGEVYREILKEIRKINVIKISK